MMYLFLSLSMVMAEPTVSETIVPKHSNPASHIKESAGTDGVSHLAGRSQNFETIDIQLLMTGHINGVGSEQYYLPQLKEWESLLSGIQVESSSDHTTLVQQDWMIVGGNDFPIVYSMLKEGNAPSCSLMGNHLVSETDSQVLVFDQLPSPLKGVVDTPNQRPYWTCSTSNGTFELLYLGERTEPTMPLWSVEDFEFRPTIHLNIDGTTIQMAGRPLQELSRILTYIDSIEGLYVDAGGFVDGFSSVLDGQLSKHRSFEFEWLQKLSPHVLGIGKSELIAGPEHFVQEISTFDLPYIATNLLPPTGQESPFPLYKVLDVEGKSGESHTILFLSILDPSWQEQVPQLTLDGWSITEPNQAMANTLKDFESKHGRPETVVVLSTASSNVLEAIRQDGPNIDLLLGDGSLATHRVQQTHTVFNTVGQLDKAAPVTLPLDGLQVLDLTLGNGQLQEFHHKSLDVLDSFDSDRSIQLQIMLNRFPEYLSQNQQRIPMQSVPWNDKLTDHQWEKVLCGMVLEKTGADTVFLDGFTAPNGIGTLTEKHISDALAIDDIVEIHRIPGKNYNRFLDQSIHATSTSCGVTPGTKSPKPKGVSTDSGVVYTVATTDQVRMRKNLELLFQAHQSRKWLDAPSQEVILTSDGQPYSLRRMVLEAVQIESKTTGLPFPTMYPDTHFMKLAETVESERWWLKLNDVGFTMDSFESPQVEELSSVPESILNNPSSASYGMNMDMSVEYIAPKYKSTFRTQSQYAALFATVDGMEELQKQETGDDVRLSSTWSYTAKDWKLSEVSIMPFGEVLLDSEWTPIELEDGTLATRQSDLSMTLGIATKPWRSIKSIKVGGLVNRDLAQLDAKPNEYAGSLQFTTKKSFSQALMWGNEGTLFVYGNTVEDDASDLRFKSSGKSKLTMPISSNLGVSLYATGLLVKGRSELNDVWGYGWNIGASLDVLGTFSR